MSVIPPPLPVDPLFAPIPLRVLLGLRDGADAAKWARLRAVQLDAARHHGLILLPITLVTATSAAMLLAPHASVAMLAMWIVLLIAVTGWVALRRLRTPHERDGVASLRDLQGTAREGAALAASWAIAPLLLAADTSLDVLIDLGVITSMLLAAVALVLAPLPGAAITFIVGASGAMAVRYTLAYLPLAALEHCLFAALMGAFCCNRARALVVLTLARMTLGERDDTISLLLRESADDDADWLWETDSARRIVRASPRFAFACGRDPAAIEGQLLLAVLAGPSWESGDLAPGLRTLADKLKLREDFRDLRLPVTIDGTERWWDLSASPRLDDRGAFAGFRGVGSDVTEQRASADRIDRMARYDVLTGLPNRLLLNETLACAIADTERTNSRCAFMMVDLDRFKAVNDALGHPVGDRLLCRAATRLAQLMGPEAMCGRLGGDEFAVVVAGVADMQAVETLAQRIIDTLSTPFEIDQHILQIGASVGVAIGPRDGRTAETLVRAADLALYRAKHAGRGVFHTYDPALKAQAEERRGLEHALRDAIANDQMHLVYQPIVDSDTGGLFGFEALLRWTHPELGEIPPATFVAMAEDIRLIVPIGEWVLRSACREAAAWPADMRVSVNVSTDQLRSPDFVTILASALASSGLAPDRLELEVTESVFLTDDVNALAVLDRALALGVRLSLDDFGTGYSSLGAIGRLRFAAIKVDRRFVKGAAQGRRDARAVIRATAALAHSLDMVVIAEGVETEGELHTARDLGCTRVQGYFFRGPLPAAEARAIAQGKLKAA